MHSSAEVSSKSPNLKFEANSKNSPDFENNTTSLVNMIPVEKPSRKNLSLGESRAKARLHLLETTQPNLLLQTIFRPYLLLAKLLGIQPIKMHAHGGATFHYCSWNVAYSLVVFGMFLFDTAFFVPIMRYMNKEQYSRPLVYVTEILLVFSQICTAFLSYIFMAVKGRAVIDFWNCLQKVLLKLVARCPSHLDLVPSYRAARLKIVVWLMFEVIYGVCYLVSFEDEIRGYLQEQQYGSVMFWFIFGGFGWYSIILSIHVLHSTCFTTFVSVLTSAFKTLARVALKQDAQGTLRNAQSPLLFQEVTEMYEDMGHLKTLLGNIYGVYLGLEILAMIICVTINLFFMVYVQEIYSSLFLLNLGIALPYLIWLHNICVCGGELNSAMKDCYRDIRKGRALIKKRVDPEEMSPLEVEPPEALSAAGYFLIDMPLFTSVMGTIATYLVVMLQFMFSGLGTSPYENNNGTVTLDTNTTESG